MNSRTVMMKPEASAALKGQGLTDEMIADMTKTLDDGHSNATTRIAELDAQIAQLENDRAYWIEKQSGYAAAIETVVDVEEVSDVEPSVEASSETEAEEDGRKT